VAKTPQNSAPAPDPDPLAAVVLHTLVSEGRNGLPIAQIVKACERDLDEVEAAVEVLLADGLARGKDDLYRPTRAAIRADELSF